MIHVVEVSYLTGVKDPSGQSVKKEILELGLPVKEVSSIQVYELTGALSSRDLEKIGRELLTDHVTQAFSRDRTAPPRGAWAVEVWFKPGVTDVVGESVRHSILDLGFDAIKKARTGTKYLIRGPLAPAQVARVSRELLSNALIHQTKIFPSRAGSHS